MMPEDSHQPPKIRRAAWYSTKAPGWRVETLGEAEAAGWMTIVARYSPAPRRARRPAKRVAVAVM